MKVKEIMTRDVAVCRPDSTLAEVATMMWHRDCGSVPVISADGHVTGVITDRDIAIAVATKHRLADRIQVREVTSGQIFACGPEDRIEDALTTMRARKVRRLPVVDGEGHLQGILSLNDVALHATGESAAGDLLTALQGICAHGPVVPAHAT